MKFMPTGNLLAWAADHFQPMCPLCVARASTDLQMPHNLVLCHLIPVKDHKLETDSRQEVWCCSSSGWISRRKVEDEWLVEDWVQSALLDVSLLLSNALSVVHQIDFHVWVYKDHTCIQSVANCSSKHNIPLAGCKPLTDCFCNQHSTQKCR